MRVLSIVSFIALAFFTGCESPVGNEEDVLSGEVTGVATIYLENVFMHSSEIVFVSPTGSELITVSEFDKHGLLTEVELANYSKVTAIHSNNIGTIRTILNIVDMGVYRIKAPIGIDEVDSITAEVFAVDTLDS